MEQAYKQVAVKVNNRRKVCISLICHVYRLYSQVAHTSFLSSLGLSKPPVRTKFIEPRSKQLVDLDASISVTSPDKNLDNSLHSLEEEHELQLFLPPLFLTHNFINPQNFLYNFLTKTLIPPAII
jgi:hypothetical protein